ncbi:YciI family protein [Nocardia callitridis]|uniref:YCII-related domain-containing protein n=1 Tax=Nocardia callitridis TaxID=648753 RepID=A0ABP9L1C3_9NOCA
MPPRRSWYVATAACRWSTDEPYLETKKYIASFYLLDCDSLARAQQIAADMPFADAEPVELWPVLHDSASDV